MRKKYKILLLLGCLAMVICGALVISACEQVIGPHEHTYPDGWVTAYDATCQRDGLRYRVCSICNEREDDTIQKLEHTLEVTREAKDATCMDPGYTAEKRCKVCKQVIETSEPTKALGHDLQTPEHYEKNDGKYWHRADCSRCDYYEEAECNFELESTAATCTKAAHHKHTCTECGYVYEHDDGVALGHKFGDWFFDVDTYDASRNDEDGEATVIRQHKRVCSNPGHTPDPSEPEVVSCTSQKTDDSVDATCTAAGYIVYECPTCKATHSEEKTDALGHDFETDENGARKYTSELIDGEWYHYFTCKRADCPDGKKVGYEKCRYETATWQAADCTHPKTQTFTCMDCKKGHTVTEGEPLGHSYGPWEHKEGTSGENSMHIHTCQRTNCEETEEKSCTMVSSNEAATCQKPGKEIRMCADCKHTEEGDEITQLDHNFGDGPYVYNQDEHSHYRTCLTCKQKIYEDCAFTETITTSKTCTTDEITSYKCSLCNASFTKVTQESTGHEFTRFTGTNKYQHTAQCDHCEVTETHDHDFSESNICAVCSKDGLTYAYEDTAKTKAKVVRTIRNSQPYNITTRKIVIPEEVNIDGTGKVPVVAIGTSAFYNNQSIVEVELPLSLEMIGYNAFQQCRNLEKVYFKGHVAGEANVTNCSLNRIEMRAFQDCTSLTHAVLPNTLQFIGQMAFEGCSLLSTIVIPEQVTEIQDFAFEDTAYYKDPRNWTNDILYIGRHLIKAKTNVANEYEVRDNVISISAEAFKDCKGLTKITLPATLKAIDKDAFAGCEGLLTVVFKGTYADFFGIRFDNDMASPMHYAKSLNIEGAEGDLQIPEGTTVIPAGMFKGSQIESIEIPASVTSIGAEAFKDCGHLASITFEKGSNLLTIGKDVVTNTPFYKNEQNWTKGVLYLREKGTNKAIALVAVNGTKLEAYEKYDGETDVVGDEGYKQILVEEGTLAIAPGAFADLTKLRMVRISASVIYLGADIFKGCTGLDRVDFRGTGRGWFAYTGFLMGRSLRDSDLYGGSDSTNYTKHKEVARKIVTFYSGEWKRGNYGS